MILFWCSAWDCIIAQHVQTCAVTIVLALLYCILTCFQAICQATSRFCPRAISINQSIKYAMSWGPTDKTLSSPRQLSAQARSHSQIQGTSTTYLSSAGGRSRLPFEDVLNRQNFSSANSCFLHEGNHVRRHTISHHFFSCDPRQDIARAAIATSMSSRLVKKQLAALQQGHSDPDSLHRTAAAPKKQRLRPREKRKKAQKSQKALNDQRGVDTIVLQNIKYFKSTSQSKATAQAAAVLTKVS